MSSLWSSIGIILTTRPSHKYLSLPLIPVEEFLAIHPEHNESSEHELMIARINHEHAEREKLEQARQELLKRKQALIAENKKRKDDLANLDQDLERFIDVSTQRAQTACQMGRDIANACRPRNQSRGSSKRSIDPCIDGVWFTGTLGSLPVIYDLKASG